MTNVSVTLYIEIRGGMKHKKISYEGEILDQVQWHNIAQIILKNDTDAANANRALAAFDSGAGDLYF